MKTEKTNNLRINKLPVTGRVRSDRKVLKIFVNNQLFEALEGETLSAALWANGLVSIGQNPNSELPRGMYCGIGHCYECRVNVDGIEDVRSCLIHVREGMQVTTTDYRPVNGNNHGA